MKPKERNLLTEIDDMTKYQVAQFKRAIKRELSKEVKSPKAKNHVVNKHSLPDYVKNNPWY